MGRTVSTDKPRKFCVDDTPLGFTHCGPDGPEECITPGCMYYDARNDPFATRKPTR
jgi:hypothetical protein